MTPESRTTRSTSERTSMVFASQALPSASQAVKCASVSAKYSSAPSMAAREGPAHDPCDRSAWPNRLRNRSGAVMRNMILNPSLAGALVTAVAGLVPVAAHADAVTEWNIRAGEIVVASGLGTPPANRVMAIAHSAAYVAANAIEKRYAADASPAIDAPAGASVDAAIAAAHRTALSRRLPAQRAATDAAYDAALARLADARARSPVVAVGEQAALALLAQRQDDARVTPEAYRPHTAAGRYVPTMISLAQ